MASVSSCQVWPLHKFKSIENFLANTHKQNVHIQSLVDIGNADGGLQQVPDGSDVLLKLSRGEESKGC